MMRLPVALAVFLAAGCWIADDDPCDHPCIREAVAALHESAECFLHPPPEAGRFSPEAANHCEYGDGRAVIFNGPHDYTVVRKGVTCYGVQAAGGEIVLVTAGKRFFIRRGEDGETATLSCFTEGEATIAWRGLGSGGGAAVPLIAGCGLRPGVGEFCCGEGCGAAPAKLAKPAYGQMPRSR